MVEPKFEDGVWVCPIKDKAGESLKVFKVYLTE